MIEMNLTTTQPIITSNIFMSLQSTKSSTLSNSDRNFIEFTRCLYKAKSVVQELQAFSNTVKPTLLLQRMDSTQDFIRHVNQYLEGSFRKFNHMCKVLLVVLTKLESNQPVRRERIVSFRQEVILEWRKAIHVRRELLILLQKKDEYIKMTIPSPTSNNDDDSMSTDDEESDTTPEPTTSSDSSSS